MSSATYVLVPGAGDGPRYWHLVAPLLRERGHTAITPELPIADPDSDLGAHADAIVAAARDAENVVLVAQSLAAFIAPLACARLDVALLVLLCPMIPAPGETPGGWWESSGQTAARRANELREGRDPDAPYDEQETFFHDVPAAVVAATYADADGSFAGPSFDEVWPLTAWPDVPTAVIAGARDRVLPLDLVQRLSRERLGAEPEVVDAGHCAALARPAEVVDRLEALRSAQVPVLR